MKNPRFWVPVIASVLATPALLLLVIGSAGVGHNKTEPDWPHAIFPFPFLAIRLFGDAGLPLVLLLWVVQYPLYGVILGLAAKRGWGLAGAALLALLAIHGLAVAAESRLSAGREGSFKHSWGGGGYIALALKVSSHAAPNNGMHPTRISVPLMQELMLIKLCAGG
jgi:hypothetical protein